MRKATSSIVLTLALVPLSVALGCGGEPAPAPAAPVATAAPSATAEPPAAAAAPAPTTFPVPEQGDLANHYLDPDTLFGAAGPFVSGYVYAFPAKLLAPPGDDGTARLYNFVTKREVTTRHHWRTRRAKPEELAVGALALVLDNRTGQGVYAAPAAIKDAYGRRWWIARIVSVRSRAEGYVLVSGNLRVAPDAIRFLEGDTSPRLTKQGKEDKHFIAEEHWFTGDGALPDKGTTYAHVSVPVKPDQPMEGGEGRFVQLDNGRIVLTKHAWQTRQATRGDLRKDAVVLVPDLKKGQIYAAPETRAEALTNRWWAVKIESPQGKTKGTVGVHGGYQVSVDALRVVK